jgi:hypothetical protein
MARNALLMVLALTLLSAAPALAQTKPGEKKATSLDATPSATAAKANRQFANFGQAWTAMPDNERHDFLLGFVTSIRIVCASFASEGEGKQHPQDMPKLVNGCISTNFPAQIMDVKEAMTALYQDKANNHIPYGDMLRFAMMKVTGKPYEDDLAQGREQFDKAFKGDK